jgi:hypothetical protein
LHHLVAVFKGREEVAPRSEVLGNGPIGGEKALGVSGRLESLHAPLPLACRLVRVFRAVVEVAVLAVLHTGQNLTLRGTVAAELVRDHHPWYVGQALEQLAEKLLRGLLVPSALHENIQYMAVLIHGAPQVVAFAMDRQKDLIEVPRIARPGTPPAELIGIDLPEFPAPVPLQIGWWWCVHGANMADRIGVGQGGRLI